MNVKPICNKKQNNISKDVAGKFGKKIYNEYVKLGKPKSKQFKSVVASSCNDRESSDKENAETQSADVENDSFSIVAEVLASLIENAEGSEIIDMTGKNLDLVLLQVENGKKIDSHVDNMKRQNTAVMDAKLNSAETLNISSANFVSLMKMLKGMAVTLDQILENQGLMMNVLQASSIIQDRIGIDQSFSEKYNLEIPFKTLEEFENLNQLLQDPGCLKDFISSLFFLIDRRNQYVRTINNILKKYMSRDIALQYTAQKQSGNKLLLKSILLYNCLLDMVLSKHTKQNDAKLTEKEVLSALGTCFTNR